MLVPSRGKMLIINPSFHNPYTCKVKTEHTQLRNSNTKLKANLILLLSVLIAVLFSITKQIFLFSFIGSLPGGPPAGPHRPPGQERGARSARGREVADDRHDRRLHHHPRRHDRHLPRRLRHPRQDGELVKF